MAVGHPVAYSWIFGDGTSAREPLVKHTFTHEGSFRVALRVEKVEGVAFEKSFTVTASGQLGSQFKPGDFERVPSQK